MPLRYPHRAFGSIHRAGRGAPAPVYPMEVCYECDLPIDADAWSVAHGAPDGISRVHEACCVQCGGAA